MKKFALRAMTILCIVVALCIFFSGTVRTITTPKVRYTSGKSGKFKSETALTGRLYFRNEKEYTADIPEGQTLKIKKVSVSAGALVAAGDRLFTSTVVDYDKQLEQLQSDYDTAEASLRDLMRKNSSIKLTKNETAWMEAYYANRDASRAYLSARVDVGTLLRLSGLTLPETGYPDGASDELKQAIDTMRACQTEYETAAAKLETLNRYAIDDSVWTVLTQKNEYEEKLEKLEAEMTELAVLSKQTATVRAGSGYYITELSMEKNATISCDTVLFKYSSSESLPYIRVDITNVSTTVTEGTQVSVNTTQYGWMNASVSSVTAEASGARYAYIEMNSDMQSAFGGLSAILNTDIQVKITTRAQDSTCLIPASAVRGSGSDRYVYIAEKTSSTFGGTQITAHKTSVTVLNESSDTVSVQEDLSYSQIIYGEDRQISDGDTVMEYTE